MLIMRLFLSLISTFIASARLWGMSFSSLMRQTQYIAHMKGGERCFWVYHGVVRNPLNGKEIAYIHGLEEVVPLRDHRSHLLQSINPFHEFRNFTYLCKKAFIYADVSNHSQALDSFRLRPKAPKRNVQPVRLFSEQVTLGYDPLSNQTHMTITWPSGRTLKSSKLQINEVPQTFPLSLFMRQFQLVSFVKGGVPRRKNYWISFAPEQSSGRTQEYYLMKEVRLIPFLPAFSLEYKRYGECPPWFSTGRLCSTELTARKYYHKRNIPRATVKILEANCPEFISSPLSMESFALSKDILDDYQPWHSRLSPFKRNRENLLQHG